MYTKSSPIPPTRSPLLQPLSEIVFDINSTERTDLLDDEILASQNRYLYCIYCHRHLLSKAGKVNHEKSHVRSILKEQRLIKHKINKRPRIYTCRECDEEFEERGALNKHAKTHSKIIECNICHEKFKDRMEFDLHDAIYDGKNYELLNFPAHRTRSQSRLSCHSIPQTLRSSSCDGNFFNGSRTPSDFGSLKAPSRSSRKRATLSMSSRVHPRKKSKSIEDWIENNQYINSEDEEFADDVSVRSYAVSRLTNRSVSPPSSVWSSRYSEASFLQDRYLCSEPTCMKTFPTLNWVTTHEMVEHKKLALFRCRECRKRFTTSGNLQQHRINTHPNVLICVLCDNPQRGTAAIEEHFDLHQKYSVKCDVCGKMFLSKYYLDEHLKYRVHRHLNYSQTKAAILIRVDRRETREFLDFSTLADAIPIKFSLFSYSETCRQDSQEITNIFSDTVDDLPWRS